MARHSVSLPMTKPRIHLVRMAVFVVLAGFIAFILHQPILTAFAANPGLNGLIVGVLLVGTALAFREVSRLFREVRWVNAVQAGDPLPEVDPVLLAPVARILANRRGREGVSPAILRSMLDSVGLRLDESREVGRYLTGLLVFLGLLGTFWGLLETVGSVGDVIRSMKSGGDATLLFDELKAGLAAPLSGMGISFSSSLFGLAGSLILGFLDLQAGQAQNRFYNELEDWLSAALVEEERGPAGSTQDIETLIERLSRAVVDAGGRQATGAAVANLAEGVHALVKHMRTEQQMMRDWVEAQAKREDDMRRLIERLGDRSEAR
jgi:hypothetical protein